MAPHAHPKRRFVVGRRRAGRDAGAFNVEICCITLTTEGGVNALLAADGAGIACPGQRVSVGAFGTRS